MFDVLRQSITHVTEDRRLQLLVVAFCFGAFFEGASGFGTPVAVTGAILIGLGFSPLAASGLSLIANTAPVAFGALGTPIIALQSVTASICSSSAGWSGASCRSSQSSCRSGWSARLRAGGACSRCGPRSWSRDCGFAIPQFLVSNYHGPWLVDVVAAVVSMALVGLFLRVWHPKRVWTSAGTSDVAQTSATMGDAATGDAVAQDGRKPTTATPAVQGLARVDAVDHPERRRLHLGPAEHEGVARLPLGDPHSSAVPAPGRHARAAGGA